MEEYYMNLLKAFLSFFGNVICEYVAFFVTTTNKQVNISDLESFLHYNKKR